VQIVGVPGSDEAVVLGVMRMLETRA
jgi:hypothetical protein